MLRRLLIGLLKGIVIGSGIGALLHFALHLQSIPAGILSYLLYGAVALLSGVVAGQPPWREGAWLASILKGLFGFGIGAGLYWLGAKFLGGIDVGGLAGLFPPGAHLAQTPLLFAPAVSTVYATLVELDDGGEQAASAKPKTGVRVSADADDANESVPAERPTKGAAKARR